ncbi:hypothetical protein G6F66_014455 [Rhizopus arrhizus]|nr:hypothetical protein G6F66_014455 [Rhizopus arrhizus]
MRVAVHVRHHRPPQGLHPAEPLLPARGRLVRPHRRTGRLASRPGAHADPAAAGPHERDGLFGHGHDADGRLPDPAGPLPSQDLVGQRAGFRRHCVALPGRHARHPDEGAAVRRRPATRHPLRLRRGRGPQAARPV